LKLVRFDSRRDPRGSLNNSNHRGMLIRAKGLGGLCRWRPGGWQRFRRGVVESWAPSDILLEKFALTENKKLRNMRALQHFVTPPYLLLLSLRSPSQHCVAYFAPSRNAW